MSELMNARNDRNGFRWRLLSTVSAAALLASVCAAHRAAAAENDAPPFWIELGGMLSQDQSNPDAFLPPFAQTEPRPPYAVVSPAQFQRPASSSWDGMAKIAYEPSDTGWVFSVGVVYGKNSRQKYLNQKTPQPKYFAYQDLSAKSSESHAIVDFQAGTDVGLGMFGSGVRSTIDLGVRYAQFNSRSQAAIQSQPTNVGTLYGTFHRFYGTFDASRKFTGVGPSLSWDADARLIGNPSAGHITVDWGLNGAVLFGRQRAKVHYHTSNTIHIPHTGTPYNHQRTDRNIVHYQVSQHTASPDRDKEVIVPNLGGFAGVSWRLLNAKVSLGYRADFFFGAMDGGIDAAHKENVGFYGPFASVSVGLGG